MYNSLQDLAFFYGVPPIDTNGAPVTSTAFDTRNGGNSINKCMCLVGIGNIAANISAGSMRVTECETSGGSYTAITGLTFTDLTAAGSDNKLFGAYWTMGGPRMRFFKFELTGGAGATLVFAVFIGSNLNQSPNSATERGLTEQLIP
jgi:hypothetical protein